MIGVPTSNSQKDPIVRVQAHEIRRLLKKYYEEEGGKDSLIRVELPTGAYVPVFGRRAMEEADGVELPTEPATSLSHRRGWLHLALTLTLAAACLVLAFLLVARGGRSGKAAQSVPVVTALPEGLEWFWHPFLPPAEPPLIVIPNHPLLRAAHDGDSPQTLARGHEIPKADLPEFPRYDPFSGAEAVPVRPIGDRFHIRRRNDGTCQLMQDVLERWTEVPGAAITIGELRGDQGKQRNPARSNQSWSGRVFLNVGGFHFQSGVIVNTNPRPGEKSVYKPEFDPVTNQLRRDYAIVLMLPNERSDNRVLLIYGIYTQGSEAAIEYLTNPERMTELAKALLELSPTAGRFRRISRPCSAPPWKTRCPVISHWLPCGRFPTESALHHHDHAR